MEMEWSKAIHEYTESLTAITPSPAICQRIVSFIDFTTLNESDTTESVAAFFEKAKTDYGHVAAVCVFPQFVRLAATQFDKSPIKVATVANFPSGNHKLESVLIEIGSALEDGAQEIDVVFPYERYLAGEQHYAHTFVESCKAVCGEKVLLKVILETGALSDPAIIADACFDVLAAGADFVKTSTGKIAEGATLDAAATMLLVIRHMLPQLKRKAGFKVSGGIRTLEQAAQYVQLADNILGRDYVTPATFRIGTSRCMWE